MARLHTIFRYFAVLGLVCNEGVARWDGTRRTENMWTAVRFVEILVSQGTAFTRSYYKQCLVIQAMCGDLLMSHTEKNYQETKKNTAALIHSSGDLTRGLAHTTKTHRRLSS